MRQIFEKEDSRAPFPRPDFKAPRFVIAQMREQPCPIVEISGSPIDRELFADEPTGPGCIEIVFEHRTHCITGLPGRKISIGRCNPPHVCRLAGLAPFRRGFEKGCRKQIGTCILAARPFRSADAPPVRPSRRCAKAKGARARAASADAGRASQRLVLVLGLLQAERLYALCADGFRAVDDPLGRGRIERPVETCGPLYPLRRQGGDANAPELRG